MPPKKLSISRIRQESRLRSTDPDLNRARSSSANRASPRYRQVASSSKSRPYASSGNSKRPKRPPQPKVSERILRILDDDIEETRVQNLFAPDRNAQRQNVSYRPLSLTQQSRRDGSEFRPPSLASMCCSVIATSFDALLPSRDQFDAAAAGASTSSTPKVIKNSHTLKQGSSTSSNARKRSRGKAFGAPPDSDEDAQDYVPSDGDEPTPKSSSRSTRSRNAVSGASSSSAPQYRSSQLLAGWSTSDLHYLTRKTSEQLKLLSPAASFLLFQALVEHAPQYLTKTIASNYFLPPILDSPSSDARRLVATTAARTHVWLPASIPLLSSNKSAASNLVAHLTSALLSAHEHRPLVLSQSAAESMPLAALPSRHLPAQPASFALRSLQLHGLTRLQDATIARFFESAIPASGGDSILKLDTISLKGCIAVGDRTVMAICRSTGSTLRHLNLDYTDVGPDSVYNIMTRIPDIETLKLGYNYNLSDKNLKPALEAPDSGALPFFKLVNLRLRHCKHVADGGVADFLRHAHKTIRVLDISGTGVGGPSLHNPDFSFLRMNLLHGRDSESAGSSTLPLRKLNLLDTHIDYSNLIKIIDMAPNMDTLLLRQMPSSTTRDGMIALLQKLALQSSSGGWRGRAWKRLHLRILDVGDEFAELFPCLLTIFPRLHLDGLKSSQSNITFFAAVPDEINTRKTIVKHLKLPDARLSEHAWQFLPLIKSLQTLDLSNTAVPGESDTFLTKSDATQQY